MSRSKVKPWSTAARTKPLYMGTPALHTELKGVPQQQHFLSKNMSLLSSFRSVENPLIHQASVPNLRKHSQPRGMIQVGHCRTESSVPHTHTHTHTLTGQVMKKLVGEEYVMIYCITDNCSFTYYILFFIYTQD